MKKYSCLLSSLALVGSAFFWSGCGAAVLSDEGLARQAGSQFNQMKKRERISTNAVHNTMIQRIGKRITDIAEVDVPGTEWEFVVFQKSEPNAFAMPGGKVGVYTGMLQITQTEAGLARVLAHEVAHAVAHHGAERISRVLRS